MKAQITSKTFLILSLIIAMTIIGLFAFVGRQKIKYEEDVKYVYSVADKLGYIPSSFVRLHRIKNDYVGYDIVTLVFVTEGTVENFSHLVDTLGFQLQTKYGPSPDNNFLDSLFGSQEKKLTLFKSKENHSNDFYTLLQLDPMVTTWTLIDNQRSLDIEYADTNMRKDGWTYDGVPLSGNIVVISLKRHITIRLK